MKKIRIGILGCANIAYRSMIPAILSLKEKFELVAVSSRYETRDKAFRFAKEFNCEAIIGYENLVEREDIDAVYLPLPTGLHKEWILRCLESGKSVYAEKSIALTSEESNEMVKYAKQNNLSLMEGYMFCYHPQHTVVKKLISDGKIGAIRSFSAAFGFPPLLSSNFRYDNAIGGGALKDAAGYVVKAVDFILEDSKCLITNSSIVDASVFYNENGTSLYGNAFVKGLNGFGGILSFGFDQYYQCNYKIWGSKGIVTALKAFTPKADESVTILFEHDNVVEKIIVPPFNHFIGALEEFYSTIYDSSKRINHYEAIIKQSQRLDEIEQFSKI